MRQFTWVFEDAKNKDVENIMILSGDHLYRMDYMDLVQNHIDRNADITLPCGPEGDSEISSIIVYLPQNQLSQMEKTCGPLLPELQKIWDEVGEPECEKNKMLLELERQCSEAYRRKVDQANECRARLRKAVADFEAEVAYICSAMGEQPLHTRQNAGSLKEELEAIVPLLEDMRKRKTERRNQFAEVTDQIRNISKEICVSTEDSLCAWWFLMRVRCL